MIRKVFLLTFAMFMHVSLQAQVLQKTEGAFSKLVFDSTRKWTAARWYIVGQWVGPNRIKWLGGGQSLFKFPDLKCLDAKNPAGSFYRKTPIDLNTKEQLEILSNKEFFAIEVPASLESEKFTIQSGVTVAKLQESCRVEVDLKYSWLQGPGDVRPLLFLSPQKNKYFGYEIHLEPPPDKPESVADISMDLYMGYTYGSFPNIEELDPDIPGKTKLHLAPMAKARGEWVPFQEVFGMYIGLEQVMASWGGGITQQALYSDWTVGLFLEDFLPVGDALQVRGSFGYYEHLADDNIQLPTFSPFIKGSKYLTASGLMNFYFGNFWLLGASVDWGIPGNLAGSGRTQSMLSVNGRLGMRVTGFMFLMAEGGFKDYKASDVSTERMLQGFLGIRLDL